MGGYAPLKITGNATGLVQSREEFILPEDAYPKLENAYVWRERIRRRQALSTLGRLRRKLTAQSLGNSTVSPWSFNIYTVLGITGEPAADIEVGSITITLNGPIVLIDQGDGTLETSPVSGVSGTINYSTGDVVITGAAGGLATTITFNYFPGIPVMGLRIRERNAINIEQTIAFDQKYAYIFQSNGWEEFIPGTTWTGSDSEFFWSTNYWTSNTNAKVFWVTNFSGPSGDPIRYTDGTQWIDFAPQIDSSGDVLGQCLALVPFRGRLVAFNTWEGVNLAGSINYRQRIRWAAIGTPFSTVSAIVSAVNADAWRDDIRGQGGFLDIPTNEDIITVGFVRDNLVIYCERSTWQLRYTGRSIAPFQIERVNSELGAESTFSAVQFDTSLVGVGDKGIVECDSFKSERIDIKIPDLIFEFNNANDGPERVHGIRDFQQKLAYWIFPYGPGAGPSKTYPNRRLVYNYENDSWAIFTDSLTCLGTFQPTDSVRWNQPPCTITTWEQADFPWVTYQEDFPALIGGNQQGFVMYLGSNLQPKTTNDETLSIADITFDPITETNVIFSYNHNLQTGQVISFSSIPVDTPYEELNDEKFGVVVLDADTFQIWGYDSDDGTFSIPSQLNPADYVGGGRIKVRDGFSVVSKKFNFLDEGENIQLGFLDILMVTTEDGAITMNLYLDYNDNTPINTTNQNLISGTTQPDTFFNSVIPTSNPAPNFSGSKFWHRAICNVRGGFLTIEYTFSNGQLVGDEQEQDVQIDAQVLYIRKAGRQMPIGA